MRELTVLMPTFKHARYLADSIQSVLDQDFSDFTLIVLVDGSPDNSLEIATEFSVSNARVAVVANDRNRGRGYCRNVLLRLAQTELLAWMDSDDLMYPTRLGKQIAYMSAHEEVHFLATELDDLNDDGTIVPGCHCAADYEHVTGPEVLSNYNPIANPTIMFRRSTALSLGGYDNDLTALEDLDFWRRLYRKGMRVYCYPERLQIYRTGTHSS